MLCVLVAGLFLNHSMCLQATSLTMWCCVVHRPRAEQYCVFSNHVFDHIVC